MFDDGAGSPVGVVVLVPADQAAEIESLAGGSELAELDGYTFVPPAEVLAAAERFASSDDSEPLTGEWVGFGPASFTPTAP